MITLLCSDEGGTRKVELTPQQFAAIMYARCQQRKFDKATDDEKRDIVVATIERERKNNQ